MEEDNFPVKNKSALGLVQKSLSGTGRGEEFEINRKNILQPRSSFRIVGEILDDSSDNEAMHPRLVPKASQSDRHTH